MQNNLIVSLLVHEAGEERLIVGSRLAVPPPETADMLPETGAGTVLAPEDPLNK